MSIPIDDDVQVEDFQSMFREFSSDIVSWFYRDVGNSGVQIYTDNEICEVWQLKTKLDK